MQLRDRRTVVICIGNELIADDAAGYEVYCRLGAVAARVEYCGVGGVDILPLLDGETDLVVVDAVQLGAAPGTVHLLAWSELPQSGPEISAHGLGLREAIEIGRILTPEQVPERVTLVGIEGRCFNRTREFMTREVSQAIDRAVAAVRGLVEGGHNE
ncbi:MAG TPA: peptidase [Geobacter sp.]|nr:peptidase [Geobacter sp.]